MIAPNSSWLVKGWPSLAKEVLTLTLPLGRKEGAVSLLLYAPSSVTAFEPCPELSASPQRTTRPAGERVPEKQLWTVSPGAIPDLQPWQSPKLRWFSRLDSFLCGLS